MNLPQNPDINTQSLARLFDKMSESYKIFWFKAIVEHVSKGKMEMSFDALINTMIKNAWYMVTEFKLNLGPSDTLEKTVKHVYEISGMKSSEKAENIIAYLENSDDKELKEFKRVLTLNVPYRLQAPFMQNITNAIWRSTSAATEYINLQPDLIYRFSGGSGLERNVLLNIEWHDYMKSNLGILEGWIDYNLIMYLQRRNPSVPGIASKIYPPQERKLDAAKSYWKEVIKAVPVQNIYSGELLTVNDVSIDHFVPWSYVAHDELWNLVPTTKSLNSSKSNRLPKWDLYFPRLCDIEYEAYKLVQENERMKDLHRVVSKCMKEHVNDEEVRYRLYREGQSKEHFGNQLKDILLPAYESARNLGFGEWTV